MELVFPGLDGKMEEHISLDPRKQELFEARFLGVMNRSLNSQDSNLSNVSNGSEGQSSISDKEMETPEKRTPTDRKRKRKNDEQGKSKGLPTKKISEYFESHSPHGAGAGVSPNRTGNSLIPGMGLARSPPPPASFQPVSPSSSNSNSNFNSRMAYARFQSSPASGNSIDYTGLVPFHPKPVTSTTAQTELTLARIVELEQQVTKEQQKENTIEDLQRMNGELRHQLEATQRLLDRHKDNLSKCLAFNRKLLIDQCVTDRKEVRRRSMENRLRIGQHTVVRKGASFEEEWVDGWAYIELKKKQRKIEEQKGEIERLKKTLQKRKPPKPGNGQGGRSGSLSDGDGVFAKPQVPSRFGGLPSQTSDEYKYYEQEEILKIKSAQLKKEEAEVTTELEKLEREKNLHIREMKRIMNEDNSRFRDNETLNDRYLLLCLLGKGGFSEVHKAFDLKEQRYVACKIHQLNKDWKEDKKANYIKHAMREYEIHKKLDHPRIVKLYDVFEIDNNSFCTVLEYCDGNDLDYYLKQHKCMGEKEARSLIMQAVSALKYLNEITPPVIHYDLKPGNILLGSGSFSGEIKITDFGLSKVWDMNADSQEGMELTSQGAGTYWYLPPECFVVGKSPPKISSKVDVWSIGVIFYQCLYGRKPFGHNQSQATILENRTILNAKAVEFPSKPAISQEAKNFVRRCLTYRKEERPDVHLLARDPYLHPSFKKYGSSGSLSSPSALLGTTFAATTGMGSLGSGSGSGSN
ncbi:serine/threonine-protein kinase tousled-like 2 isoform X1 [Branchiostoma floridae x Branchiostoma belcheri]